MNKYHWVWALPCHLLVWIIVLAFGTAILPGETTYQGLTPGQSRSAQEGQVRESRSGGKISGTAALGITFGTLHHRGQAVTLL